MWHPAIAAFCAMSGYKPTEYVRLSIDNRSYMPTKHTVSAGVMMMRGDAM
jgi:hypothetical protein